MIKKQSVDPDVELAARQAYDIVQQTLVHLPEAKSFDYGGHDLKLGDYKLCETCTASIAEAQQAAEAIRKKAHVTSDETVREHLDIVVSFFELNAQLAIVRAELHNGVGTEKILNTILGYEYDRKMRDDYSHTHGQEN